MGLLIALSFKSQLIKQDYNIIVSFKSHQTSLANHANQTTIMPTNPSPHLH